MTIKEEFDAAAQITGIKSEDRDSSYLEKLADTIGDHLGAFVHRTEHHVDRDLARLYRRTCGVEFTDSTDAIEKTKPQAKEIFMTLIWNSLASGVLIGQADERFADPSTVFGQDFELASVQYAAEAAEDDSLVAETEEAFEDMIRDVGEAVGFSTIMGGHVIAFDTDGELDSAEAFKHLAWKVFDFWKMLMEGAANAYFCTGYEIGKARHEKEILDGIMNASEET